MSIPYTKMHGCHNEYICIDNRQDDLVDLKRLDLLSMTRQLSNRKTGLGADGLIIMERSENPICEARMRMFNADGSEGRMCGNGIRLLAKLLHEKLGQKESFKIETKSGVRECFVVDTSDPKRFLVKVNMGRPSFLPSVIPVVFDDVMVVGEDFEVEDQTFKITCVSMGNPHCVIPVENLEAFNVEKYGSKIEKHEAFPEGVNVEFIEVKDGEVFQRTWERGSGETQACGTGACAVGVSLILGGQRKGPLVVHLRGGDLTVEWDGLRDVWLTGDAVTVSSGNFEPTDFLEL